MKKIININVGGFAFVIEEQAYEIFNTYLEKLRANLGNGEDTNEVMNDIEMRIAELFKEKLAATGKEVVELIMVDEVISIMGKPEDFGDAEEKVKKEHHHHESKKRLYRDPEEKMLGGVCAGLGNYFGWDPLPLRIIFVVMFFGFGTGFLVYLVLWILVPEAKSTSDRLRMQGKPVNVDTIKQRFNDFAGDIENLGSKENQKKIKNAANSFGSKVENMFIDFGKAVGKIFGAILMIVGVTLFVVYVRFLIMGSTSIPESAGEEFFFNNRDLFFDRELDYYFLVWGALTLVALIIYSLVTSGAEMLFNIKMRVKPLKYLFIVISVIATCAIIYGVTNVSRNYSHDEEVTKKYELSVLNDTLSLAIMKDDVFNDKATSIDTDNYELIKVNSSKIIFGYPTIRVKLSETGKNYFEVEKYATGARNIKAIENCEAIDYPVIIDTSKLILSPVYSTSRKTKFRSQEVQVTLYLAKNVVLQNKENMKRIFDPYESYLFNEDDWKDVEMYRMTEQGLKPIGE